MGGGLRLVCVEVSGVGWDWGALAYVDGRFEPRQLYVREEVVKVLGIWEVNAGGRPRDYVVLPREPREICFTPGQRGPPHVPFRGKYVEVDEGAIYLVPLAENPALPAPTPLQWTNATAVKKPAKITDVGPPPAQGPLGSSPQVKIETLSVNFRSFSGSVVASFKVRALDDVVLSPYGCLSSRFVLPNGSAFFIVKFTPRTQQGWLRLTASVYVGGQLRGSVSRDVYSTPLGEVFFDLSQWVGVDKEVELSVCNRGGSGVRVDAFVYTMATAASYATAFRLEPAPPGVVVSSPPAGDSYFNGTHVLIPGFTPPPGYIAGSGYLDMTVVACSPRSPASVRVYWGPYYVADVAGQLDASGCRVYRVYRGVDIHIRESIKLGGAIHPISVGPFDLDSLYRGIKIYIYVDGLYRPEINARSSIVFKEFDTVWGYYTASPIYIYYGSSGIVRYMDKIDVKIYGRGSAVGQFVPVVSVGRYQDSSLSGVFYHCGVVEARIRAWSPSRGQFLTLTPYGSPLVVAEGGQTPPDYLSLFVEFVTNILDVVKVVSDTVLKVISWATFTADLVKQAVDISADVSLADGGTTAVLTIRAGALASAAYMVQAPAINWAYPDTAVDIRVQVTAYCGGRVYTYSTYFTHFDQGFIASTSTSTNVHYFRTLTCGMQEAFYRNPTASYNRARCNEWVYS